MQTELRRWYSQNRRDLKSRDACFKFYLGLSDGSDSLKHILQIGVLTQLQMSKVGVILDLTGNQMFAKVTANDPMVALQDSLVRRMFTLRFSVQKHRLHGLALFMFAYPWRLVLLAHPDEKAWFEFIN